MDWIECQSCWAEYKIISDVDSPITYCPYCGEPVELPDEDTDEYERDD